MELNDLKTAESHEEGSQCFLLSADGTMSDAFVIVQGPDSPAFRLSKRTQRSKLLTLRQQGQDLESYDFLPLDVDMAVILLRTGVVLPATVSRFPTLKSDAVICCQNHP